MTYETSTRMAHKLIELEARLIVLEADLKKERQDKEALSVRMDAMLLLYCKTRLKEVGE